MDEEELVTTPLRRSTLRSFLIFGAERELALSSVLLCSVIAFSALFSKSLWTVLVAIVLWPLLITALRMLAQHDPMLSQVYRRHVQQQSVYCARSTPFRDK